MSPAERKRLTCRLIHRLEAAEHAVREAAELAQRLGLNPDYLQPANEDIVAMMNDAYMEYPGGKHQFEQDHPHRRSDGSRTSTPPTSDDDAWINEGGASGV